ncbi:MAG: DUF4388 domain-containing protein [Anaerolineales bacterium]
MALQGNLSDMQISDLIQLTCQSGATSQLVAERGDETITLYFDDGEVVHAASDADTGEEAVYDLLTWETGAFKVNQDVPPPTKTIDVPWSALIMEGMRRWDEQREVQNKQRKEQKEMAEETRRERLAKTLRNLIDTSGDISGVAVVSRDGLIMAADLPANIEQARVGAVSAAILSLSGRSVGQLKRGDLQQTMVQGGEGNIVITYAGKNAVLVGLTGSNVNLGMVFLEVREAADTVAEILG